MRSLYRRWLATVLSLALVLALLPPGGFMNALAAVNSYFTISPFSTDINNPTTVNVPTIDLSGTFNSEVNGSTISYKIQQIVNNQPVQTSLSTQAPIISQNSFTFKGIPLFAGLNKIIIEGKNTAGNTVSTADNESAYIFFANVPIIYDIRQIDGTTYDTTVYIDEAKTGKNTLSFTFHAPNTSQTTINGIVGIPGGGDMWIASGIPLNVGMNTVTIVAQNSTQSYTVKRKAVFFNGQVTFGLTADPDVSKGDNIRQSLDGNPVLGPTVTAPDRLGGPLKGSFIVDNTKVITPDLSLLLELVDISDPANPVINTETITIFDSSYQVNSGVHTVYDFTAPNLLETATITSGKKYKVRATLTYAATSPTQVNEYSFTYRDPNSVYIKETNLLYGVSIISGTTYNYTSKSTANSSFDLFEAPLTFGLVLGNATGTPTVTISNTEDATGFSKPVYTPTVGTTYDGAMYVVQIPASELFAGLQTMTVTVDSTDSQTFKINYVPAPTIFLTNVYNGQVFTQPTDLTDIQARFTNFTSTEQANTKVYVNQSLITNAWTGPVNNVYTKTGVVLQYGANTILVHGEASGIPIDISLTVYVFSNDVPIISDPIPMDSTFTAENTATFKRTGDIRFSTTDKEAYFRLPYSGMDAIKVQVDGVDLFGDYRPVGTAVTVYDPASAVSKASANNWFEIVSTTESRIKLKLKDSGSTNVTVMGTRNGVPASMTFEVVREVPPYTIVSPVLPDERVINQNFWTVKIKAEQVDSVVINKVTAAPVTGETDTYSVDIKNLKPGKNTVKFTVTRAGTPINGSFDLYYANQNTVGAQYKTPLSGSTISAFNKMIEIKFPKNTLFQNVNSVDGNDYSVPYLFDQQQVRFGIASQTNGTVEPKTSITNTGKSLLIDTLNAGQYIFAGPLFWIDAGYYDDTSSIYKPVDGLDPYTTGTEFYNGRKWLKPTNRGDITIKYDDALRDVAGNNLAIWKFANNKWENIGGVVNTSKHTITAPFDGFGYYAVMMLRRGYADVTNHPWGREYLETMLSKGIMLPKNNNDFGVYDIITRGEFAEIMVKALGISLDYDSNNLTFYDVPNVIIGGQLYDYRYIETAFRSGIIRGLGPGVFNPTGSLTRQDAAVIIARAVNAKVGNDQEAAQKALSKIFTDSTIIDYYAAPSVLAINKLGIVNGVPNELLEGQKKQTYSFNPIAPLSRAEAAKIAYKTMQYLKKLPK